MHNWRNWLLGAALSVLAASGVAAGPAAAPVSLNIEAQPIGSALNEFARQTGLQVVLFAEVSQGVTSPRLAGSYDPQQALRILLANTGLSYEYINERTVAIRKRTEKSTSQNAVGQAGAAGMRVAQADQPDRTAGVGSRPASPGVSASPGEPASPVQLDEIVVTAQKRTERLIDTPQSVTVLSAEELAKLGATQLRDFANTVPGLSLTTAGTGYTQITLRGVTTGFDLGSTVAIYVDDVPYGSSSPFADGPRATLDSGLFDLDHIEVLRGPQGTLYGASTMGGLFKYVTKRPDAAGFSGETSVGVSVTGDGGGVNYNVAAAVNIPIVADRAALRASAFEAHDGGYLDNIALGQKDVNRSNVSGGRLDLLLTPVDRLSVRVAGFLQNITRDGEGTADYTFAGADPYGALGQSRRLEEPFDQHFRLISGTVAYDLPWASLTSISSYQTMQSAFSGDITGLYASLCPYAGYQCGAFGYIQDTSLHKFTQELRLASRNNRRFEWLLGAFYTHERSDLAQNYLPYDLLGVLQPNTLITYEAPSTYQEYAAFGDLTWHINDSLDITGGVRYAGNDQDKSQIGTGLFGLSHPDVHSADHVFTYLADARYHFNERATGYVRYATGYRPGGPNLYTLNPATGQLNGTPMFQADRLRSYEAGFKGESSDRRFGVDLAGYYIDWSNIQVTVVSGGFSTIENAAGGAKIHGVELALTARPIDAVLLSGSFAYQDAKLSRADADLGAYAGESLPNVPRFTAAMNADYKIPLATDSLQPSVGATARYQDQREASFDNNVGFPQYHLPGYVMFDLRSGLTINSLSVQLIVRNLLDRHAQLSAYTWRGVPQVAIAQPRTLGVELHYGF